MTLAGARSPLRVVLLLYVLLVACPVRYWPLENDIDPTWRFALNHAPANGYAMGRDYVNTTGPLVFLVFPQNIGNNLVYGLVFQGCLWLALAAIFADIFFRGGFRTRNLALFSILFGLSAPLFWFNSIGPENLMLAGALLLLVMFQLHGGWSRYAGALFLIGILPLFKISAGVIGFAALTGFLAERLIERRRKALPELLCAAVFPVTITCGFCLLLLPSVPEILRFLHGSAEMMSGYSSAMTLAGPPIEFVFAAEATLILLGVLYLLAMRTRRLVRFYVLLLAGPFFVSMKHGFVRHDEHVINFFCFIALALALVALTIRLGSEGARWILTILLIVYGVIWQRTVSWQFGGAAFGQSSGRDTARLLSGVLPFDRLRHRLDASVAAFPDVARMEPALIALIGNSPVASLSANFTNLAAAGMRITLFPTLQRFGAYTPFLDQWNAAWIKDKGPRYLVFDGRAIDGRDPWAETPAMWLEIYRWYDTRLLGPRNLLLERRVTPRFSGLESVGRSRVSLTGELPIPPSDGPVFWTMKCPYSTAGRIRKTFARILPVTMSVHETGGRTRATRRIIAEVLVSPVLGNYLPSTLAEFAAVFQPVADRKFSEPGYSIDRIQFGGDGATSYENACEAELLRPVR